MNEYQQYYGPQFAPQQLGELAPQGFFGGLIGAPLGGLIGRGIGGLFGNANLGRQIGSAAGGIGGGLLPFGTDPVAAAYAQQAQQQALQQAQLAQLAQQGLAPQGWFGNIIKSVAQPLGGAIGGAFGNAGLGNTIGGIAGQLGGMLPFAADPVAQAYAQQAQLQQLQQLQQQGLAPQGWFGNIIKSVARPLGGVIGGAFGNSGLGNTIGGIAGHLGGMLPFAADPVAQAYAQQEALMQQQGLAPQGWLADIMRKQRPYTSIISPTVPSPFNPNILPFGADPVSQAYAQGQQDVMAQQGLAPQGWFGNLIRNVAQPLGGAIGGAFGNAGLGNTIGGIAGQLGGMLPFGVDPLTAAYAQQAQLAAQQGNSALYGQPTLH